MKSDSFYFLASCALGITSVLLLGLLYPGEGNENFSRYASLFAFGIVGAVFASAALVVKRKSGSSESRRQKILQIILESHGKITPHEVAAATDLSIKASREYLDELCMRGKAALKITENEASIYLCSPDYY